MGKKKKWLKLRHRVVRNVTYAVLSPVSRWKYGVSIAGEAFAADLRLQVAKPAGIVQITV